MDKKSLRILWLIISFVILSPLLIIVEIWNISWIMRYAKYRGLPKKWAMEKWMNITKTRFKMNIDYVENGF